MSTLEPLKTPDGRPMSSSGMSTTSSGGLRRKKKKVVPLNLEEVFNALSNVTSSNLNPPPGKMVLTPRSAEICLKLGINPEILKIRDIDSFWEPGIDPAVQRIRHEAYVQRRYDTMKQCRIEKKRMAVAEFEASTNIKSSNVETAMTPEMLLEQQREQSSSLIQLEMQRIEKMQKRQEKELEQMIQYEANRVKVQQEMERRIQESKKKDEMRKKQLEKRMKLVAEERRLRELQKAAMEEAEEENRRAVAQEMHRRERELAMQREYKLRQQKKLAKQQELERKAKNEAHRQQVEQFFAEEQMQLRQRLEQMQYAEKKKQDAIMKRQQEHAENLRIKREMIEKRIEENMEMAQKIEEKRKEDFIKKQEHFETIRETHIQQQERERELKSQELALQEQRRKMILIQQQKEEERNAHLLLKKFEEEEKHVEMVQRSRMKEHEIQKERKSLRTQMKLENVQRVQRIGEYKRSGTLKKIESNDTRVKSMMEQRMQLVEERRRAANKTRLQKEAIAKVMEEVRTNATKANKMITMALSGTAPLGKILSPSAADKKKTKKRSSSAGNLRKKTKEHSSGNASADQLGLGRSSVSAGEYDASFQKSVEDRQNAQGGGGGYGQVDATYSAPPENSSPSKPFVSPYDANQ